MTFVNDAEWQEIKALAEEQRISLSLVCHRLIRDALAELRAAAEHTHTPVGVEGKEESEQ